MNERVVHTSVCIPCDVKVRVKLTEDGEEFEVLALEVVGTGVTPGDFIAMTTDDEYDDILEKAQQG